MESAVAFKMETSSNHASPSSALAIHHSGSNNNNDNNNKNNNNNNSSSSSSSSPNSHSSHGGTPNDLSNVNPVQNPIYQSLFPNPDLPIANISRIMKKSLPENAKIAKDAKECVQDCVSELISFITSEASEKCLSEKRKTINGDDILYAMRLLGFDNYEEVLKVYLSRYRMAQENNPRSRKRQPKSTSCKDTTTRTTLEEDDLDDEEDEEDEEEEDRDEKFSHKRTKLVMDQILSNHSPTPPHAVVAADSI